MRTYIAQVWRLVALGYPKERAARLVAQTYGLTKQEATELQTAVKEHNV